MKHHRVQGNLMFRLMALEFHIRDWIRPPLKVLREARLRTGLTVLDFGCGAGSFALAAARLVGSEGRVYAFDIHPLAERLVRRAAAKSDLGNIRTVCGTDLAEIPSASVDVVLLYDVLHEIPDPTPVLTGLHRVLKPEAMLSVRDRHLDEQELLVAITARDLFRLAERGQWTYGFRRINGGEVTP